MSELSEYIKERAKSGPVYMPYLTAGDPDFSKTVEYALAMIDQGADLLELGIPFSDPTADGPVIQKAMFRALNNGAFSLEKVFETARAIHEARPQVPLIFLTYLNPILTGFLKRVPGNDALRSQFDVNRNIEDFLKECQNAGIKGVVIPDLPHEQPEARVFRALAPQYGVDQILMIAPNTEKKRFKEICKLAGGFIYNVTSMGVTGERKELPRELGATIRRIKKSSGVPVLAGFGISEPEQVKSLVGILDGIIVGSLNHRIIEESISGNGTSDAVSALAEKTRGFVEACRGN